MPLATTMLVKQKNIRRRKTTQPASEESSVFKKIVRMRCGLFTASASLSAYEFESVQCGSLLAAACTLGGIEGLLIATKDCEVCQKNSLTRDTYRVLHVPNSGFRAPLVGTTKRLCQNTSRKKTTRKASVENTACNRTGKINALSDGNTKKSYRNMRVKRTTRKVV